MRIFKAFGTFSKKNKKISKKVLTLLQCRCIMMSVDEQHSKQEKEIKIMTNDEFFDFLVEYGIATEEEILLVSKINGYNEETLNDILYVRTGNRSVEQFLEEIEL